MKLGIFLPNWVGDAVMATPTLRAVRRRFGQQARMVGIARPAVIDTLAGTDWVDQWLPYDPRAGSRELRTWSLVRELRQCKLDAALLLTNSLRTGLLAWLSGAKQCVGYARNGRGWLLTDRLRQRRERGRWVPAPVLDDYLRLAYALGCAPESRRLELATLAEDEAQADRAWSRLGIDTDQPVVALNCSGAFGAAKLWPVAHFAELAQRIVERLPAAALVLCGPGERDAARQIVSLARRAGVVSLADEPLSLGLSKASVRRARLMVTTDSGPRHFATAFGVPVITLFGPTHQAWSETHDPRAIQLQHILECGPCQQRVCPLGHHRCMTELTVDEVWEAVERAWLQSQPRSRAA